MYQMSTERHIPMIRFAMFEILFQGISFNSRRSYTLYIMIFILIVDRLHKVHTPKHMFLKVTPSLQGEQPKQNPSLPIGDVLPKSFSFHQIHSSSHIYLNTMEIKTYRSQFNLNEVHY